jgi:two-component system, chemotaxis family, protein-glutamate methylesterase/glutaminase
MIKVLVIDDSAVMRAFLSRVVDSQPDMQLVGTASDPVLATDRIRRNTPDVVTLDVEMPRMNGLDFLRQLMAVRPLPVVMISSLTRQGADTTIRALELGAVDFFPKPAHFDGLEASGEEIAGKIRAAASARVARHSPAPARKATIGPLLQRPAVAATGRVIGIGASTGGVEALRDILTALPAEMPPILIAQHMPAGFTETLARRLDSICRIAVKQADDGEAVCCGVAYVAAGGRHLELMRRKMGYVLRVSDGPPVNHHRPSVDTLFHSMAQVAGDQSIGVMLTGMGADGAQGMLAMSRQGAFTIAQDENSCVVFGMPRQAIALGAAREVLALGDVAQRLAALSKG